MSTNMEFWLSILGITLTVIFGFLGIYIVKAKRYPGRITYVREESIGLFDTLVKNFPQITIQYEGENISKQIVLVRGYLINTGDIDIKESMVDDKLKISLPPEFAWLNSKIVEGSIGNKFHLTPVNKNELELDLGLFKKDEYLRLEALVEVPISQGKTSPLVSDKLSFSHRIADTSKVEIKTLDLRLPKFGSKEFFFKTSVSLFVVIWLLSYAYNLIIVANPLGSIAKYISIAMFLIVFFVIFFV